MNTHRLVALVLIAVCSVGLVWAAAKPDLSGTWVLNKDRSDDPVAKMQEALGGGQAPPPGPPSGAGRPGGPGGGFMAPPQITIRQSGDQIEMEVGQRTLTYTADGQSREIQGPGGRSLTVVARWEDSKLVIEQGGGMFKTVSSYELSADGKQLLVVRKVTPPQRSEPVEIRLVYDRK